MRTLVICLLVVAGCSTVEPKQLVDARHEYEAALLGPAATYTPADLYEAKKALDVASFEFTEQGDSERARNWAYVASRKVSLANAKARMEQDRLHLAELTHEAAALRDAQISAAHQQLNATQRQLEAQQRAAESSSQQLAATEQQLQSEHEARTAAEGKLDRAMKDLSTIAAVKEERRGTVITLSGSVLFPPGQSNLLGTAQDRLDQVAEALKQGAQTQRITVEGYTDNVGPVSFNQQLSTLRATAVRDYLVSHGVPAERIDARGYGSSRPITDNATPENRANNRRVEIVVHPEPMS